MSRPPSVYDPDSGALVDAQPQSLYHELFEHSADATLIIEDNTFVDCNQATMAMLRYRSKEALLRTHPSELSPERQPDGRLSYEKANEMMDVAMAEGSHRFEWDHVRADGEVFPVEVLLTPFTHRGRRLIHCVWRDITERKRLEHELRQAQKLEAVGKLTGGIAHDFNNLLVAILGHAELLEMDLPEDDERRESVREIRRAGERAADLVSQLLSYSRRQVLRARVLDLNEVLRGLAPMLDRLIGEDVALIFRLSDRPLPVMADPGRLEQVVMNLVTNGRDAMPDGGTLTLATRREEKASTTAAVDLVGPCAVLEVSDTGHGVPPAIVDRIFDPFFTTRPQGTGLGLATVIGIVRQSGGDVRVHRDDDAGAVFTVQLPLSEETPAPQVREEPRAAEAPTTPATILLVEDEEAVARVTRRILADAGHTVHLAADGREALDLVAAQGLSFDLLLTDVIMPGLNGSELARRLRVSRPGLKVLYVSGYTNEVLTSRGVLDEGVALVQKPFSAETLRRRVREILADD